MARNSDEDVLRLISRIYEAALDSALWPRVLVELTDAVGGSQAMMGIHDVANRSTAVIAPGMSAEDLASYRDHWARDDILWHRTNSAPVGRILEAERFAPREEFVRTPIYNEWHRPLGIGVAGLGVNLFVEDGVPAVCGIKRPAHRDAFSCEETAVFAAVAPHLVRAAEIQRRLQELEQARAAAGAVAEEERSRIVVVDASGRVLEMDAAARRFLASQGSLFVENGRLQASDSAASAILERLVKRCGSRNLAARGGGSVAVPRGRNRAPLHLDVAPIARSDRRGGVEWLRVAGPSAVIAISDPAGAPAVSKQRLIARFALTPAEADLAIEIARGDGRQAAARRLGISVGTVRTHLMRVFEKTGVRRQAELVRILSET